MRNQPRPTRPMTAEEQQLAMSCYRMAYKMALQAARRRGLDQDGLLSLALVTLCRAAQCWRSSFGAKFTTYAGKSIMRALGRWQRREGMVVTYATGYKGPTRGQRSLDWDYDGSGAAQGGGGQRGSEDSTTKLDAAGFLGLIAAPVASPGRPAALRAAALRLVRALPDGRCRRVVWLRFIRGWTLARVGAAVGLTPEACRKICLACCDRLRRGQCWAEDLVEDGR